MCELILAKCHQGQQKNGVENGPDYLSTLFPPIKSYIVPSNEFSIWISDWNLGYYNIFLQHQNLLNRNVVPIVLGGDHSVAVGSVSSSLKKYEDNLVVVWIDAHADIDPEESSISKNKHGMPVASLLKLNNQVNWIEDEKSTIPRLKPKQIIYFGIRDLDPFEIDVIKKLGITHLQCK